MSPYREPHLLEPATEFDPSLYIEPDRTEPVLEVEGRVHPRQPHLGYGLLALLVGFLSMLLTTVAVLAIGAAMHVLPSFSHLVPSEIPRATILGEGLGYGLALAIVVPLFRRMWHRPFGAVLRLHLATARAHWIKLVLFGIVLSVAAQAVESLLTLPKDIPLDAFFRTPATVWMVAVFGTLIAPPMEELLFRGFLLPGFAIAYDWLRLPRTPEARFAWTASEHLSRGALVFSAVVTSLLFGAMHAAQLGFAWNAVALLSCVGGVLAVIRLRFNSLAASSLVHMAYNGFIFAIVFVATDGFRHLDKLHGH